MSGDYCYIAQPDARTDPGIPAIIMRATSRTDFARQLAASKKIPSGVLCHIFKYVGKDLIDLGRHTTL